MQSAKYQLLSKPGRGGGGGTYPWLTYIGELLQGLLLLLFTDSQVTRRLFHFVSVKLMEERIS